MDKYPLLPINNLICFISSHFSFVFDINRPEIKEGKEAETEKKAEQENNESDKIEKELEKDKVIWLRF